jgi:hypothetical protein
LFFYKKLKNRLENTELLDGFKERRDGNANRPADLKQIPKALLWAASSMKKNVGLGA